MTANRFHSQNFFLLTIGFVALLFVHLQTERAALAPSLISLFKLAIILKLSFRYLVFIGLKQILFFLFCSALASGVALLFAMVVQPGV